MPLFGKRGKGGRWYALFATAVLFAWASLSMSLFPTSHITKDTGPGPSQLWSSTSIIIRSSSIGSSSSGAAKIRRVAVSGERDSGALFVRDMILSLFDVSLAFQYGAELHHFGGAKFFGNISRITEDDDVLFLGVVREPLDWILSIAKNEAALGHLGNLGGKQWENVLFSDWRPGGVAQYNYREERMVQWLQENRLCGSLFELRSSEGLILSEDIPKAVKHYALIRYEDLVSEAGAGSVMQKLQGRFNLEWRKGA